jgi:hypothetical protein
MELKLKQEYAGRRREHCWTWSGTLGFRSHRRRETAHRIFRDWMALLQAAEAELLDWHCTEETGIDKRQIYLHVLIAGLQGDNVRRANALWRRMAGVAVIGQTDPSEGSPGPALKLVENAVELILTLPGETIAQPLSTEAGDAPIYSIWRGLVQNCHSPRPPNFKSRGPKRAVICRRWKGQNGFKLFLQDMGVRPSALHRLCRIDTTAAYCQSNCRWAVPGE